MTHKTRRAFLLAVGGAAAIGTSAPVTANPNPGPPLSGSGTGTITAPPEIFPVREVGGNRFEDRILHGAVTGTLEGTFKQQVSGMVHKGGRVVFNGTMTFDGQVGDCGEGVLNLGVSGRGHIEEPGFPITEASVRVLDQSANTIDVTGTGTVFQKGPALTYDIQYVCR